MTGVIGRDKCEKEQKKITERNNTSGTNRELNKDLIIWLEKSLNLSTTHASDVQYD